MLAHRCPPYRVVAARRLGLDKIDAYILEIPKDISLGMEKSAKNAGLRTLDDIQVLDYAKHPLIEITERLMMKDNKGLTPEDLERSGLDDDD